MFDALVLGALDSVLPIFFSFGYMSAHICVFVHVVVVVVGDVDVVVVFDISIFYSLFRRIAHL